MSKLPPPGSRLNPIIIDDTPSQHDRRLNHPFRPGSQINPIPIMDDPINEYLDDLEALFRFTRASSVVSVFDPEDTPVPQDQLPIITVRRNSPSRGEPTVTNPDLALSHEPPAPVPYERPTHHGVLQATVTVSINIWFPGISVLISYLCSWTMFLFLSLF